MNLESASPIRPWLGIALLAVVTTFAFLGSRGIYESTEGRYALCAAEMLRSGDWLEPTLLGKPHWTKPPPGYWAIDAGVALCGRNGWGARLANGVFVTATVLLVGWLGTRLRDRRTGILAGLIYATSLFPQMTATSINTDTLLCFWEVLAVLAYWQAFETDTASPRAWGFAMWGAFGLGFFTKGPPALLPLAAILLFRAMQPPARRRGRLFTLPGVLLFLGLGLWWYAVVMCRHPGLFGYFLGDEVLNRVASDKFGRNPEWYQPFRIYLPLLLFGGGLWSWYLFRPLRHGSWARPSTWRRVQQEGGATLFLALWILVPFVIFSLTRSRLATYVLPLFPPVAIALATAAARTWTGQALPRSILWLAGVSAALIMATKAVLGFLPELQAWAAASPVCIAGRPLARFLPREMDRDNWPLYALCRPFDGPGTARFLLVDQQRHLGFDFYAGRPVLRVALTPHAKERNPGLAQVLDAARERPVAAGEDILVCEAGRFPALEAFLRERHTVARELARNRTYRVLEVVREPPATAP